MFSGLNADARNHYFLPRLDILKNDDYLDIVSVSVGRKVPKNLRLQVHSLRDILRWRKNHFFHRNHVASIVENACQHDELRPISLVYRLPGNSEVVRHRDICKKSVAFPGSYPFNLYKYKIPKNRLTLRN